MDRHVLTLLILGSTSLLQGLIVHNPEVPQGCVWRDETLDCRLHNISEAPAFLGNLSTSRIGESVTSLDLECSAKEVPLPEAASSTISVAPLPRLERLRLERCRTRNLGGGAFSGMSNLKSLVMRSRNGDWSPMVGLELHRDTLRGLDGLQELDLASNNLWNVPGELLCPVPQLTHLNLSHNELQDLATLGFAERRSSPPCGASLQILDLSHNDLAALPDHGLAGLRSIVTLKLQNNAISVVGDLALDGLGNLRSLNLSTNRLVALPPDMFNRTRELRELVLSNNSLSVLAPGLLEQLEHLQSLDLSRNKLTSDWVSRDAFSRLGKLLYLDLAYNDITRVDSKVMRGLVELQVLKLEHNSIVALAGGCFRDLGNLRSLTLSHNKVMIFDASHTLGLGNLNQLFMEDNRLRIVHKDTFRNLSSSLQDLSLSGNLLVEIPEAVRQLKALQTLDLGNNQVAKIEDHSFLGLRELYGLRLVDCGLENISRRAFESLPMLQALNLASNKLRHIEQNAFAGNPLLQAVRLDGNQLTEIRGVFQPNHTALVWLNVSSNKLLWFDYSNVPMNLEWLDIHDNQIAELGNYYSIDSGSRIKMLDASRNLIIELSELSVPNSVESLFLNDNHIRRVAPNTFIHKANLTKVVLRSNRLQHLELTALALQPVPANRELPTFQIGNNPILCDCTMEWLAKINDQARLRQHPRVIDLDAVTCDMVHSRATPQRPLLSLLPKDFVCRYETHCFALCHCCDFDACDCEMTCPDNCSCYHDHSWSSNVVDCSNAGYRSVPSRIPMDATEIYLDGNDLGAIASHAFIGKRRLEVLFLNNSGISAIHNRTFNGVEGLRVLHLEDNALRELKGFEFEQLQHMSELYLDHNAIAKVANETFSKMRGLETLRLDNNRIVDFEPWEALRETTAKGAVVSLEGNAWSCECVNTAKLRAWLAEHRGGGLAERMYCRDGIETLAQAIQRCTINPAAPPKAAISRGHGRAVVPAFDGGYGYLLAGALASAIAVLVVAALLFAFQRDLRLWAYSRWGLRLGRTTKSAPPADERERLYDGYFIYSTRDEDFVARCVAAELEQAGLALCLHWRDLPPARVQDTLPPAAAASRRIVIAFSPVLYANEWRRPEFRSALRSAIDAVRPVSARRRRIIIILAAGPTPRDPELQLLLQTCTVVVWGEKRFWEKLRYAMPDSRRREGNYASRLPALYATAPTLVQNWTTKAHHPVAPAPTQQLLVPIHAPTPTPTQSTYVSSASSRAEDDDSGAEHQHTNSGYSALHANGSQRPSSLSSRSSHLYSTIPELPLQTGRGPAVMPVPPPPPPPPSSGNSRTWFV